MRSRLEPALLALALTLAFVLTLVATTGGGFALPLDDPYIYLQYAAQNADGELFRYNHGDPTTTGATSLLWAILLTPLALVLPGTSLAVGAMVLGAVFLALSLDALRRLATRLLGPAAARPVLWMGALSGPFVWGMLSGMETPLVAWLTLELVDAVARVVPHPGASPSRSAMPPSGTSADTRPSEAPGDGDPATGAPDGGSPGPALARDTLRVSIFAALVALARPEGAVLVLLLVGSFVLIHRGPGPLGWTRWALPLAAVPLPFLANLALTGHLGSMTLQSKGALYLPGTTPVTWLLETATFFLHNLKGLLGGGDADAPSWPSAYTTLVTFAAPLTLLFVVIGGFPAAARELRERRPGAVWTSALLVGGALVLWAGLVPLNLHWSRYLIPYLPLVILLTAMGVVRVAGAFPGSHEGDVRRGLFGFFLLAEVPILLFFLAAYAWNGREIREQHVAMAGFLAERLPEGAWIATNDVGAIAYYSGRPVLDLHGLVTRDWAARKQVGTSAIWETLETLPVSRRPQALVLIPGWYDPEFLQLLRPVRSQTLPRAMIAGSPLVAYQPNWNAAGTGHGPGPSTVAGLPGGVTLVDRLDVADLDSEDAHDYVIDLAPGHSAAPLRILPAPGGTGPVVDGGRLVSGRERFTLTASPGRDLALVVRSLGQVRMTLEAGGSGPIPVTARAASAEEWAETVVRIPGAAIDRPELRVTVTAIDGSYSEGGYGSFHYWAYQ